MELNTINSQSTWGKEVDNLNKNFQKVDDEMTKLQNATYKNKGYFSTVEKLKEAFPNATVGSKAYVGTSYPYAIWVWIDGVWADSGKTGGEESLNLNEYIKGEDAINQFSNKAETDEKITELATEIEVSTEDDDNIDGMNVCDEKGRIILSLVNGHVKTKEFDSEKISNLEIMGKNLIIKNADFSSVAIGNTVVGGKYYLTPSNYTERRTCYLYNPNSDFRNFTWSTGVDNVETDGVNFYPILKGEVVKIPCDTESMIRACLCDAPMGNVIIGAMVNTPIEGKSIMFRAREDCYVGIKNNIPVFPDNSYIENYSNISSRLINKDTYERAVSYFFDDNSLPIWGGEVSSLVYHVFKGETITVKAKSSKGASLALIKQSEESGKSISTSWWANDNINDCKIKLNAGETKSFTVPEDCVMYVLSHDVLAPDNGYYPESITLTPVANN